MPFRTISPHLFSHLLHEKGCSYTHKKGAVHVRNSALFVRLFYLRAAAHLAVLQHDFSAALCGDFHIVRDENHRCACRVDFGE